MCGHRRGAEWTRITRGVHVRGEPDLAEQLAAWSLVLPARAAFTHLTAAEMRGWWLPRPVDHPIFAAVCKGAPYPDEPDSRRCVSATGRPHRSSAACG